MIESLDHHAYAIAGQASDIVSALLLALPGRLGYHLPGNPDFRIEYHDVMGIDEARALKEASERKAVSDGKKIFVMCIHGITREAQNALLKVFEEPTPETHFFLVVPSFELLLPTLRSRLHLVTGVLEAAKPSSRVNDFLATSASRRIKIVHGLLKKAEEESGKQTLVAFLNELEQRLAQEDRLSASGALREVLEAKKYSRDRAPSFKLLLEHLALVLPKR